MSEPDPPSETAPEDPTQKFRRLLSAGSESQPLPDSLIEELPEEVQSLLKGGGEGSSPEKSDAAKERLEKMLRDQGYVLDTATHGVHVSGAPSLRVPGAGALSPYDIVRLAKDLDESAGEPTPSRKCPKCEATTPADQSNCQWCGEPLD